MNTNFDPETLAWAMNSPEILKNLNNLKAAISFEKPKYKHLDAQEAKSAPMIGFAPVQKPDEQRTTCKFYGKDINNDFLMAQEFLRLVHIRRYQSRLFLFNGCCYRPMDEQMLRQAIMGCLREPLLHCGCSMRVSAIARAVLDEPSIPQVSYPESNKLCLINGVLDLNTLQLLPFHPMYFIPYQMNVIWDPGNYSYGCPRFDAFLDDVTGGDQMLLQRFWEAIGYILIEPSNPAKKFFLMQGCGDTGKSVLGTVLQSFFSPEDISSIDIFAMENRFALGSMADKKMNISMDLPDGVLPDRSIAVIKMATGSDRLEIEKKYMTSYSARMDCKLIFGTNYPLVAASSQPEFFNRVMLLPFMYPVPPEHRNPRLAAQLCMEKQGILLHAICAYRQLVLQNFVFTGSGQMGPYFLKRGYAAENISLDTVLEQFVDTICCKADGGFVLTKTLFHSFENYCKDLDQKVPCSMRWFSDRIGAVLNERIQAQPSRKNYGRGYEGILLRAVYEQ